MNLESIEAERVETILLENGAHSVTLSDAGDVPVLEPAPGETPLWADTRITGLFDADVNVSKLKASLCRNLELTELPPNFVETLADRAWEREWLKDFGPMKFGRRLWIVPGDQTPPAADGIIVKLDPGLAFGTGTHATTALCLEWLDGIKLNGKSVLDFGCGSGILAIAACKLGATSVTGMDIDLQAVTASRQNAHRNAVADRFSASLVDTDVSQQFDVVVANILADTLIENAARICAWVKPGGRLALSGILAEQLTAVETAYAGMIECAPPAIQDNWARLAGCQEIGSGMFTKCPACEIAFRVSAKVLQQAKGNVRCGGCSHAFNALEFLSEEMPAPRGATTNDVAIDPLAETSRRLLETLDELAGSDDVRIEDTGVEWRVLETADEQSPDLEDSDDLGTADDEDDGGERRYDDNSPLPEGLDPDDIEPGDAQSGAADNNEFAFASQALGQSNASAEQRIEFSETPEHSNEQGDLTLSEPEEWTDLLEEVRDPEAESLAVEEEIAAIHSHLPGGDGPANGGTDIADLESQFKSQAEALGLDLNDSEEGLTDEVPLLDPMLDPTHASADSSASDDSVGASTAAADHAEVPQQTPYDQPGEHDYDLTTEETNAAEALADDRLGVDRLTAEESFAADADAAAEEIDDEIAADAEDSVAAEGLAGDPPDAEHSPSDDADPLQTTGEFEAQIEAAASAFANIDVGAISADLDDDEDVAGDDEISDDDREPETPIDEDSYAETDHAVDEAADDDTLEDDVAEQALTEDLTDTADETLDTDSEYDLPQQSIEEMTLNQEIDQEMMALAVQDDEFSATLVGAKTPETLIDARAEQVEAIIMEGETVHTAVELERRAAELDAMSQLDSPDEPIEIYHGGEDKLSGGRRKYDPPSRNAIAAVAALSILLIIQLVHNSREALATGAFFSNTIAPIYRLLGSPVTPQWDIKGWQFEATNGNIDEQEAALVVVSQLANRAAVALPYPLVHVALTDRWENVIGSRILAPDDYLAGALDPDAPVQPGDNFRAVISIDNPSVDATGFKLNVCYRDGPDTVRCAIEDFKN